MSWGVSPWVYPVWDSLSFLDLGDFFLPHFWEVFNYYLLKYFLMVFLKFKTALDLTWPDLVLGVFCCVTLSKTDLLLLTSFLIYKVRQTRQTGWFYRSISTLLVIFLSGTYVIPPCVVIYILAKSPLVGYKLCLRKQRAFQSSSLWKHRCQRNQHTADGNTSKYWCE